MKKKLTVLLAILVLTPFTLGTAYACGSGGKRACQYGQEKKGLEDKLFHKAHYLLHNQDELGLTAEQAAEIKNIKRTAKKDLIKLQADIEVLAVDIKAMLWQDTIDLPAARKLISQKYDIKKEKALMLMESYTALKGTLDDNQKKTLKRLKKKAHEKK